MEPRLFSSIDFYQLAKREKNAQKRIRLLALAHVQEGKPRDEIAESLKVSRSSVNNWVRRFRCDGLEGIGNKQRSGRPVYLQPQQETILRNFVESHKNTPSLPPLKGKDIHAFLKHYFDIDYDISHVYRLLKKLKITL
ncbi:helix-turn-helix domain-containing protein [Photobacterium leiognathi]|uniref:helix-turn-helix domain-containing protein n=1 Tax=Photobacterium leiognathi TaxID=553611 RepID=UPI002981D513|nr:helix-turn-helix domain-containing protein [Photobacterium leiognathi]